jgi:uncharacterized protein
MTRTHTGEPDGSVVDGVRAAAEAGDAAAQLDLANRHWYGDGVERDPEAAYRWMLKAAEAGLAEAQSKVGAFLRFGWGVPADVRAAIPWFRKALRGGYTKAGYNLGELYRRGGRVPYSPRRAWFFYSKAVELGQEAANYGLAVLCFEGRGVPKDEAKALGLLRRALRGGDPEAIVEMGRFFRAGVAGPEDLAEAEARALALLPPGRSGFAERSLRAPPRGDSRAAAPSLPRRAERGAGPPAGDRPGARSAGAGRGGLAALREKAESGDAEAGYQLGRVLLRSAPGSARADHPAALAALLRAAETGHAAAAFQAGTLLYRGWGVPQDVPKALALLETAARAGNADAARFLALSYDGVGGNLPKDPEVARRWWNEAARLGDPHACYVVGRVIIDGRTTREERARGWQLIHFAAAHGFPHACGFVGVVEAAEAYYSPEPLGEDTLQLLRLGAVRGDFKAALRLAEYFRTVGGPERIAEALHWLHASARRDAAAARELARFHDSGLGVPRSPATAAAWLALASEEGDPEATVLLAVALQAGAGVPRDPAAAIRLAERAADAGYGMGARLLGATYDDGNGVPRDGARAAAWFARGVELNDTPSRHFLANLLFDGRGVDPDLARAVELLKGAAARFDVDAKHLLALMLFRGEGVSPDPARARKWFLDAVDGRHLPSLFTTLEEEALRYRPAALRRRDLRGAIEKLAADPESLPAATALELGLLYWNADAGLSEDRTRAAELLRVAALKGSALAAACLSHALRLDGDEAGEMEWLEKAARSGLPGAERHLAVRLVETGRATWEDPHVARLLESAADRGDVRACVKLASLLGGPGEPPEPRAAERIRALQRCAEEGGYAGEDIFEY